MQFEAMPAVPRAIVTLTILYLVLLFSTKISTPHCANSVSQTPAYSQVLACVSFRGAWGSWGWRGSTTGIPHHLANSSNSVMLFPWKEGG